MTPVALDLDFTKPLPLSQIVKYLKFGDALLYSSNGIIGHAIKWKTWSDVSHIEMYFGQGKTGASRDGQGVQTYDFTTENLAYVMRPVNPLNAKGVLDFHTQCIGQRYDLWGLFRFFTFGKQSLDKQFCSEYFTRACRAGGVHPFDRHVDADLISPGMYHCSTVFEHYLKVTSHQGVTAAYPVVLVAVPA